MRKIIQYSRFVFFLPLTLGANSSNTSYIQSELNNSGDNLEIILTGNYSLFAPIIIPSDTKLSISGINDAQITCEDENFAFEVLSKSTLDIHGVKIKNCFGGAIQSHSSVLTINNCIFENNNNSHFGGAIFSENSDVNIQNTIFTQNVANQGGAVYLISDKEHKASFDNCSFLYNSANEIFSEEYSITFPFFTGGGAIASENTDVIITKSILKGNYATQSGGGISISDNSSLIVYNCTFDSNEVVKFGAGISGPNVEIRNSLFTNNTSDQDGGGIYTWGYSDIDHTICEYNVGISKGGCLYARGEIILGDDIVMIGNTGYFGGSIYTSYGSHVKIYGGYYSNSTATRNGGFMYISDGGISDIYNATIENCFAVRRAAIVYVSGTSDEILDDLGGGKLHIYDGLFTQNRAGELGGGFVAWGRSTSLILSGGVFSDNYSLYAGGLLFLEQFATFEASNCLFENNISDDQGGAIYARDPTYISVSCTAINNQSPQASYIYLTYSVETSYISNSNISHSYSGTSDVIYIANSVVVVDNIEMESLDVNTQAIAIKQDKNSDLTLTNSAFRGWHGDSVITSLNPTDNTTRIIECDFRDTFSSHTIDSQSKVLIINAFVNNNTIFSSENYNNLALNSYMCQDYEICNDCIDNELGVLCTCSPLICHPGNKLEISTGNEPDGAFYYPEIVDFYINIDNNNNDSVIWDVYESSDTLDTSLIEVVPSSGIIKSGDRTSIYVKMPLETGTFNTLFTIEGPSMEKDIVIPITHTLYRCGKFDIEVLVDDILTCIPCVTYLKETSGESGYNCETDGITVKNLPINPGFWRSSDTSLDILKCNIESVCKGGSHIEDSDSYCETGNKGPYCAVCVNGYEKNVNEKCIQCDKKQAGLISIGVFVSILSIILAIISFLFLIDRLSIITIFTCHKNNKSIGKNRDIVMKTIKSNSHRLKILIVVWQILVIFPEIVNVNYPDKYSSVLRWMKTCMTFFSFNLEFLSSSCILPTLNHYGKLLVTTIVPFALFFIMIGTYYLSIKLNGSNSLKTTWTRHVSLGLVVTFLIFTSTSTIIFKTFVCDTDVLPGKGFLRSDYSVECFTLEHTLYRIYATIMIFVYPLGIPFLYFVLLYKNKKILSQENNERGDNSDVIPFRFLWKDFKPSVYYYEVIECMRRILLTGFLVFIRPGSSVQLVVACLFAFTSLMVFEIIRPHVNKTDTWLYRMGCVIIFISSYMGLLLKIEYESQQSILEIILIFLNIVLVVAVISSIIFSVYMYDKDIEDVTSTISTLSISSSRKHRVRFS